MATATFGAGCFRGVEETVRQLAGVTATAMRYLGGTLDNPTYQQVCRDRSGHAEVTSHA
jgi:peptide-methionine (S)-S-oxide reductase